MLRKLIALGLLGAGIAYVLRMREHGAAEPAPAPPASAEQVRSDQPSGASVGEAVVPDTSDDDPSVRHEERLAAEEAGEIGGGQPEPDVDPELRPVVEASGDSEETFEQEIEEEGR
jgi:hypothetical protein